MGCNVYRKKVVIQATSSFKWQTNEDSKHAKYPRFVSLYEMRIRDEWRLRSDVDEEYDDGFAHAAQLLIHWCCSKWPPLLWRASTSPQQGHLLTATSNFFFFERHWDFFVSTVALTAAATWSGKSGGRGGGGGGGGGSIRKWQQITATDIGGRDDVRGNRKWRRHGKGHHYVEKI